MTKMPLFAARAALLLLLFSATTPTSHGKNMNGGEYLLANTIPVSGHSANGVYSTEYATEYFEIYSPLIRTRYSEVYWAAMDPVRLPDELLTRFANATMAIVGYEVDQVYHRDGDAGDVSVPLTHAYNHHYYSWLQNSNKARHVQKKATEEQVRAGLAYHGHYYETEYLDGDYDARHFPVVQIFSEANGGEFRLSHHGYPKGYAQLIHSPTDFHLIPMQIDTWNRDAGPGPKFTPGPLPRSSRIPASAGYNGLIECPCSTRLHREEHMTYQLLNNAVCETPVHNASECWTAAQGLVPASKIRHHDTANDAAALPGCSLEQHADGSMDIYWNSNKDLDQDAATSNKVVAFASAQINVSVALDPADQVATITLVGPADRWFGVGFGTNSMCLQMQADECTGGGPYAIIVAGNVVTERKLDHHGPGVELTPPSVTVASNTVDSTGQNRTVVLTRPLKGPDSKYFSFDPDHQKQVPVIVARGCSMTFAQHCGHGPAQLNFVAMDLPTQVCQKEMQGSIGGASFSNHRCPAPPSSDLFTQKNPTCFYETYAGGLTCCRHLQSLLDEDQEIPWNDQYLEYHLKFRFYFEEYQPPIKDTTTAATKKGASHKNLQRVYRQTEFNAGEYDIVQCPEGTPPSHCVQVITAQWKLPEMVWCSDGECPDLNEIDAIELIYAGPHCHAPSCISMELYHVETGQLLCHVEPVWGDKDDTVMQERGFLALPPCLWGTEDNLPNPIPLPLNATLMSIKKNNNTLPHTGEMASWQMRGYVYYNDESSQVENVEGEEIGDEVEEVVVGDEEKFMMQTKTAIRHRRRREEP